MAKQDKGSKGLTEDQLRQVAGEDPYVAEIESHNKALLKANERLERELAKEDKFIEAMCRRVGRLPKVKKVATPKPAPEERAAAEAVLVVTDTHAEEVVRVEEMEGMASYDWETFMSRAWATAIKAVRLVEMEKQSFNIRKLNVWFLGDNATGEIHRDELIGNEFGLPDVIPNVAHIFAQLLAGLAAHFEEVKVVGLCGNHMRTTRKPVHKRAAERNWDRAIYRVAKMLTSADDSIKWTIPVSMQKVVRVLGWDNFLTHGAEINMNNRVPYYPIESTMQREAGMRRKIKRRLSGKDLDLEFDYVFAGHFHHRAVLSDDIFLCPSMIGANEFSKSKIHMMSLPRQLLTFFTAEHGVTGERLINLHDARDHQFIDPRSL